MDGDATRDAARLDSLLGAAIAGTTPARMHDALAYAVFGGGSRIRPRLCLLVARAASGAEPPELAYAGAAAVELIHCASLVHDDLPSFDDAELRRGRPALHRAFGEATAVLVGDALILAAFDALASAGAPAAMISLLARAAGARGGLVSGQASELDGSLALGAYHDAKTGGLFAAAAELGATSVGADRARFRALGLRLGRLYQIADDAADCFGSAAQLGKPTGRDRVHRRPSASTGRSPEEVVALMREEATALAAAIPAGPGEPPLRTFVEQAVLTIVHRTGLGDAWG